MFLLMFLLQVTHKTKYLLLLQIVSMLHGEPDMIQQQGQLQYNHCLHMENHLEN